MGKAATLHHYVGSQPFTFRELKKSNIYFMGLKVKKKKKDLNYIWIERRFKNIRPCLVGRKFSIFSIQTFRKQGKHFSYENKTKTKYENKENKFTIFNILYMNQKTILCCFPCFRIKSKTWDLVDWDKTKTQDCDYFLIFFPFCLPLRFSSHQAHEKTGL